MSSRVPRLTFALALSFACGGSGATPASTSATADAPASASASAGASTRPPASAATRPPAKPAVTPAPDAAASPTARAGAGGSPASDLRAFPGAEGFGAHASGGRGGAVIHVTTLAAAGPGSLQEALDRPGPRTIVFDVSGVIDDVVILSHGDVTVAGQTSPGGITVRGLLIQGDVVCEGPSAPDCPLPAVAPENFIVRHLRIRPAGFDDADGAGDGIRLHHARKGILDHLSVGNASDEAFQMSFASDVTVQHVLLAETLGEHVEFGGMLVNYSDPARGWPLTRISIHHTMWNRIFGRLPELSRENVPDREVFELELSNNVLYAPRRPIYVASANPQDGSPLHYRLNLVGNATVQNPSLPDSYGLMAVELGPDPERPSFTASSSTYLADNCASRVPAASGYQLLYNANDFAEAAAAHTLPYDDAKATPSFAAAQRHDFPAITYTPCGRLVEAMVAEVGAFPRDPMDRRLLHHPASGTFDPADLATNPAGDALALGFDPASPPAVPPDGDRDGMPDAWERAHGLDPAADDHSGTSLSKAAMGVEGYTNLEVYLHELAVERVERG